MSKSYTVRAGDTFAIIARKQYGGEAQAGTISTANPGALEPLAAGTVLVIPDLPDAPVDAAGQAPSSGPNEVAILINGVRFRFWSDLRITGALDGMDTVTFSAPFDAKARGFREAFRPFSYAPVVVTVGGAVRFTGIMVGVTPDVSSRQKTLSISAYSIPGVLNDCPPPVGAELEFDSQTLKEIAEALAAPFGIGVTFTGPVGAAFDRVALNPGDTILGFLSELARQRSLVVSSTPAGRLLFQQSAATGKPVAVLQEGASPVFGVSPTFSPQQYYSHVTALEADSIGTDGTTYTVKNPHLTNVVRPYVFVAPDVEGGDLQQAAKAKAGRMFGNAASYSVRLDTWRDNSGELWRPNTTIKLQAPDAMIYSPYEFIVRGVSLDRSNQETAELELVIPGSFRGEVPEALPWD